MMEVWALGHSYPPTYLSILQSKHQRHVLSINNLLLHLGGNPTLSGVWLPGLGANIVGVRHGCVTTRRAPEMSLLS
jgi:hypothetical protein